MCVKFCEKCHKNKEKLFGGYFDWLKDDCYICPVKSCGGELIDMDLTKADFETIVKISKDSNFIDTMIDLKSKDPIEYELKMSQFRLQVEQSKVAKAKMEQESNKPKCPKCGGTEFTPVRKKWSLLTGFATNKVELVCNNCGTKKPS